VVFLSLFLCPIWSKPLVLFEHLPQLSLSFRILVIPVFCLLLFFCLPIIFSFSSPSYYFPLYLLAQSLSCAYFSRFPCHCLFLGFFESSVTTGTLCYELQTNACFCLRFGERQAGFQNQNKPTVSAEKRVCPDAWRCLEK